MLRRTFIKLLSLLPFGNIPTSTSKTKHQTKYQSKVDVRKQIVQFYLNNTYCERKKPIKLIFTKGRWFLDGDKQQILGKTV